jgi:hypothetical protein
LNAYLPDIAGAYRLVLDMARFDPQKLAKNQASHEFAVGEFEKALLKHRAKRPLAPKPAAELSPTEEVDLEI